MQLVREPDAEAALAFLQTELAGLALRRGHLVQAVGECEVQYQGRARSMLTKGERLLVLKPDGTLLIHTAKGAKPVNWQPPGASFAVAVEGGRVVLSSHRAKPEEIVRVTFHSVRLLVAVPLTDGADLAVEGTEDDLQNLLRQRPHLVEPGFVPSLRERTSATGRYDLDGHDAKGRRLVVECKRATAGVADAQQLWRYVERLRRTEPTVRGVLVAPRVAEKARLLLAEHDLGWRELDWATALPQSQEVRRSGQASLGRFAQEEPQVSAPVLQPRAEAAVVRTA